MDASKSILLLLLTISSFACEAGEDQSVKVQALVDGLVNDRIKSHKEIRLQRCREEMLREAGEKVDSILLEEARMRRDTLSRPPKPTKPLQPAFKALPDSLKDIQRPQIPSESGDTLLRYD